MLLAHLHIFSKDPTHSSLESQYMSAQTMCLITSLEGLLISGKLVLDGPIFNPAIPFTFDSEPCTSLHLLYEILGVVINIKKKPRHWDTAGVYGEHSA
jgi:hypothetical protein